MSTLQKLFEKEGAMLFQNESMALDHYYLEPYQDANDDDADIYDMASVFEKSPVKTKKRLEIPDVPFSLFHYFMDGSRRTYKIGDLVIAGKKIYPVIAAQVRAGCVQRNSTKVSKQTLLSQNYLLISSSFNDVNFDQIKARIRRCTKLMYPLMVEKYTFNKMKDSAPNNAAIAKANSLMHKLEIDILTEMVTAGVLDTNKMLIVDGPLQFLAEDNGKDDFADLFYNVIGVSKSFDPNLSISDKRSGAHIGAQILNLNYGERTPVFKKKNSRGRVFGFWYLRIRKPQNVKNPLDGIIKVEKMAIREDIENGFDTDVIDNISLSLIAERIPTCHGKDNRWPNHLYPVYLAETMIKSTFASEVAFISQFQRDVF
ncbi:MULTISPECIES: hypothetical protein [unclassified Dehalobacter]|uniref:hypothetical protein n=1 Tax=unclassified Dehalobacter TaxID=2635733 RepID=UPI001046602C|nr:MULTISPECIES: hypothetical protein [unclassified Dehalobacter]TCX50645.1 hypothetical protein C1I36_08835 [Dehalobacter sp. 14DCB1]TCX51219.1 hypothetical protein C1I38_10575 [Dehalobacter sp. 12DCB1]